MAAAFLLANGQLYQISSIVFFYGYFTELKYQSLFFLLIFLLFSSTASLSRKLRTDHSKVAIKKSWLVVFLFWILLFLTLASWGSYRVLDAHLDPSSLSILLENGVQLFLHVIDFLGWTLLLGMTLLLLIAIPMSIAFSKSRLMSWPGLQYFSIFIIAMVFVIQWVLPQMWALQPNQRIVLKNGQAYTKESFLEHVKNQRSGLFSHIHSYLIQLISPRPAIVPEDIQVSYQEIISLGDFKNLQDEKITDGHIEKPNVIIILIESLRKDVFSLYGGAQIVMPATEQLFGNKSIVFSDAYSQATHSNYADIPPLSSMYPLRDWVSHYYPESPAYPRLVAHDIFSAMDYQTAIISSQNERWGGMFNYLNTNGLDRFIHAENYRGILNDETFQATDVSGNEQGILLKSTSNMLSKNDRAGKIDDANTVDLIVDWIANTDSSKPFYIYSNLQSSHMPFKVPDSEPRPFSEDEKWAALIQNGYIYGVPEKALTQAYFDTLYYMDKQLSRLFEYLKKTSKLKNTLVVVTADTGVRLSGGFGNAGPVVQDVVQVPLMMKLPESIRSKAEIIDKQIEHVDLLPTILDLLGWAQHPGFQGDSIFSRDENKPLFQLAQAPAAHQYSVIYKNWKLVYDKNIDDYFFEILKGSIEPTPAQRKVMVDYLLGWIVAQLDYYENPELQAKFYPPRISLKKH
ncbi:hypothetical protein DC094_05420 [Pelagibaculum spongiae]|uniref:Sulfatase N-terminal domain-containing protein n=1 Tax=Pelagibaculum spongiae TaxID=2080658 RepID=A0A2V1H6P8_9GAMM|nr:hypothetical protein DC094_05420 [Pelagibaculum spongiae]